MLFIFCYYTVPFHKPLLYASSRISTKKNLRRSKWWLDYWGYVSSLPPPVVFVVVPNNNINFSQCGNNLLKFITWQYFMWHTKSTKSLVTALFDTNFSYPFSLKTKILEDLKILLLLNHALLFIQKIYIKLRGSIFLYSCSNSIVHKKCLALSSENACTLSLNCALIHMYMYVYTSYNS